jgi:TIR domain/Caspase domain
VARHALLIGVSEFADERLARLNAPTNDVIALRGILQDSSRGSFDSVELSVNEDFLAVRDHLSGFFHDRAPDDLLLLYYSGHGILGRGNRLFLATVGSNLDIPRDRSVSAKEIRDFIEDSRAERQIVVLDCCHSGAFAEHAKAAAPPPAVTPDTFSGGDAGLYVLTASDALQFAWDGAELRAGNEAAIGFSRFTSWLVDGLEKGEAAPEDEQITMDALYRYLFRRARSEGAASIPQRFVQGGGGDLVISKNPLAGSSQVDPGIMAALAAEAFRMRLGAVAELALQMEEGRTNAARAARLLLRRHLQRESDYRVRRAITNALADELQQPAEAARQVAEESKRLEAARLAAEESKRAEAARLAAEESKRAEAAQLAAEESKRAEATRLAAEESKRAEAARLAAEESKRAEAARLAAEESKRAEAARLAAEEKPRAEVAPRVFISYSHDDPAHEDGVLDLADRLRNQGIDASIDQYEPSPPQGWPAWCEAEIRRAAFVLMVCTETYLRRVDGEEEPRKGHGVLWEARLIKQHLYDAGSVSSKFVPVLFADGSPEHIPRPVRGGTIYRVGTPEGYEALYRLLTNQPRVRKPEMGTLRRLPERLRQTVGALSTEEELRAEVARQTEEERRRVKAARQAHEAQRTAEAAQWTPPPVDMPEGAIFISYAREDLAAVRARKNALDAAGLTVWFDFDRIRAGDAFDLETQKYIQRCSLFLPVLSRNTEARTEGFFRREWRYALDRDLGIDPSTPFIIPVAIDETVEFTTLPRRFHEIYITKLAEGRPTPEFIEQLKRIGCRR